MDLETKIWLYLIFMYALGTLFGWYLTYQHYRNKEREREAVENYKSEQKRKEWLASPAPLDYDQRQRKALVEMQRYCDEYIIKDENKTWTYKYNEEEGK